MPVDPAQASRIAIEHLRAATDNLYDPETRSAELKDGLWQVVVLYFGKPRYNRAGQLLPPPKVYKTVSVDPDTGAVTDARDTDAGTIAGLYE